MDTKFIDTLMHVISYGSYADTARYLNITPAAVRGRVNALEAELGVTLISRSGQKVAPTQACLIIKPQLEELLKLSHNIYLNLDTEGIGKTFRLGAISTALVDFVPDVVNSFTQHAPNTTLTITPGTSMSLYDDLQHEKIDGAFMVHPPTKLPKSLDMTIVESQAIVFITSMDDKRSLADIVVQDKMIVYDSQSWGGRPIKQAINKHIANPAILCEMDALETIANLVEKGLGYAIVPAWRGLNGYKVKQVLLTDWQLSRKVVLVHRHLPYKVLSLLGTKKEF